MFEERKEEVGVSVTEARVIYSTLSQNKHSCSLAFQINISSQHFGDSLILQQQFLLWSLPANHWNEKQVNVILHLTHLLTHKLCDLWHVSALNILTHSLCLEE